MLTPWSALAIAALLIGVFTAFVCGLHWAERHRVPKRAVRIGDVGVKRRGDRTTMYLLGEDGWAYVWEEGMHLYLLPKG